MIDNKAKKQVDEIVKNNPDLVDIEIRDIIDRIAYFAEEDLDAAKNCYHVDCKEYALILNDIKKNEQKRIAQLNYLKTLNI